MSTSRPTLTARTRPERLPLSYAQQRLWLVDQLQGGSAEYNISQALRIRGPLDVPALSAALGDIVERHESLRTVLAVDGDSVWQMISPPQSIDIEVEDLADLDAAAQRAHTTELLRIERRAPFHLTTGPLMRKRLLRLGPDDHILVWTSHHVVSDGWSHSVFNHELADLYRAHRTGAPSALRPLTVQYGDFAMWQREFLSESRMHEGLLYWTSQLRGCAEGLALQTDRPRPARQTFEAGCHRCSASDHVVTGLRRICRERKVTLNIAMLSAFFALLARYSRQDDIVVGAPVANRQTAELENLIGFFVNSLALRVSLDPAMTWDELIAATRRTALFAYKHQDIPFERVVEAVAPRRGNDAAPLYQVIFAMQNAPRTPLLFEDLTTERLGIGDELVRYDIEVHVNDFGEGIDVTWWYKTELFDSWRIEQMANHFFRLCEAMGEGLSQRVSKAELLHADDQPAALPSPIALPEPPVFDSIAAVARSTPSSVAVVHAGQEMSASELDQSAGRIAAHLQTIGVGRNDIVAIAIPTSHLTVAAVLGTMKAGAAYLPLDAAQPAARLRQLLQHSGAKCVLTSDAMREAFAVGPCQVVMVATALAEGTGLRSPGVRGADAAYVIYTSGSTGAPKGVVVTHGGLLNSTAVRRAIYPGLVKRFLLLSPVIFDSSVAGMFWTLVDGGALHLPDFSANDLDRVMNYIERHQITHMLCLPSLYSAMLRQPKAGEALASLAVVIVAGENCPADVICRHAALGLRAEFFNEYGPTEGTVWSSVYRHAGHAGATSVPIGRAVPNTTLHLLDPALTVTPCGVVGEIVVGGAQVARGYLNNPSLTATRFVADPFGSPGSRMYRTGDIGYRNPEGEMHFLGRVDDQIKVRGIRIEPAEVEAAVRADPRVADTVVLVHHRDPLRRLVAYVVPSRAGEAEGPAGSSQVERWRRLYDSTYSSIDEGGAADLSGWASSYTGEPLPADEMRMWVDEAVAKLSPLARGRVLEIGCGTGLLLKRLAPACAEYIAADFSAAAVDRLWRQLNGQAAFSKVSLHHRPADDLAWVPDHSCDLVILNSVAQYFPGLPYLKRVLHEASRKLRKGGHIFVGDVRNLALRDAFHLSVQTDRGREMRTAGQLRARISQMRATDAELLVHPEFFTSEIAKTAGVSRVQVTPKQSAYDNELSRFRFDVCIEFGEPQVALEPDEWLDFDHEDGWRAALESRLRASPRASIGVRGIVDRRVGATIAAVDLLRDSADNELIAHLGLGDLSGRGASLSTVAALAQQFDAALDWRSEDGQAYSVVFNPRWSVAARTEGAASQIADLATNPALLIWEAELRRSIRAHLHDTLPAPMVPASIMIVPRLPLTHTGKLDRHALPPPESEIAVLRVPTNPREQMLAEMFAELLSLPEVGLDDSFFDLGGDSLTAIRLLNRLRGAGFDLTAQDIIQNPTVEGLAVAALVGQVHS